MPNDDAFSQLSAMGKARVLARLIHAETVHARDAYIADHDAPDGIRLRERNENVHRLSCVLSAAHHDSMVGLIELIVSGSQHRREELMRWIAEAATEDET